MSRGRPWLALLFTWVASTGHAQVILDGTLHPANDGFIPDISAAGDPAFYEITPELGVVSNGGMNLFHSFREFSLAEAEIANFTGGPDLRRVVSRVTGTNPSTLAGVIRSTDLPNADFFLINPNGIHFLGPDPSVIERRIEVPGSFYASTADWLRFGPGEIFAADGGGTAPELIVGDASAWGFAPGPSGVITVDQAQTLDVPDGRRIELVGSEVRFTRSSRIQAVSGEIQVAAVGSVSTEVPLELADFDLGSLDPEGLGLIEITTDSRLQAGRISPTGNPQGRIVLRGGDLVIDASFVEAGGNAGASEPAIDIEVTRDLAIRAGSQVGSVSRETSGTGGMRLSAGALELTGEGTLLAVRGAGGTHTGALEIEVGELVLGDRALLLADALEDAAGPEATIVADRIEASGGARILSRALGSARGGDLIVVANDPRESVVLREGGSISTLTIEAGRAGDLFVDAAGDVRVDGAFDGPLGPEPSGLFARSGTGSGPVGTGDAGNLTLEARSLTLTGGAELSARTFGSGDAGIVDLRVSDSIVLRGDERGTPEISVRALDGDAGGVAAGVPGLQIVTDSLEILDGAAITASTAGIGDAGDVRIVAGDLRVEGSSGVESSGIFAASVGGRPDAGNAGRIEMIVDRDLVVTDGGQISVRTEGAGDSDSIDIRTGRDLIVGSGSEISSLALGDGAAGDLSIEAAGSTTIESGGVVTARSFGAADAGTVQISANDEIQIDGQVTTEASLASGGEIVLDARRSVELVRAEVTTSVQGNTTDSNAGDITVDSDRVIVNRSQLVARAVEGTGGNIRISAGAYIESADSTVSASSERGIDGEVRIDAPVSQLKGELARPDAELLDPSRLLEARCAARVEGSGSFVVLERETLGEASRAPLSSSVPTSVLLEDDQDARLSSESSAPPIDAGRIDPCSPDAADPISPGGP